MKHAGSDGISTVFGEEDGDVCVREQVDLYINTKISGDYRLGNGE